MRIRRLVARTAAGLILITGGYAGYCAMRAHHTINIAPSGPYAVGRTVREWRDLTRTDEDGRPRNLSVWLWYPVTAGAKGTAAPYAPGAWSGLHRFGIAQSDFGRIATGTLLEAPIAAGVFPIVVFLPGLGLAAPQYATIAAPLAARGYLVAGVTATVADGRPVATSGSAAGDRLAAVWSADARFTARQVANAYPDHADARHVVYAGHSFGGAAALQACRDDPVCAGAADLDGTPYGPVVGTGLDKPILLLSSDTDGAAADPPTRQLFRLSGGPAYAFTVTGARHFDFTDYAAYYLAEPVRLVLPVGSIDGRRMRVIISGYLGAFADRAAHEAAWTAPTYPEVRPVTLLGG